MHPEEYYPQVTVGCLIVANDGDILLIRHEYVCKLSSLQTKEAVLLQDEGDNFV